MKRNNDEYVNIWGCVSAHSYNPAFCIFEISFHDWKTWNRSVRRLTRGWTTQVRFRTQTGIYVFAAATCILQELLRLLFSFLELIWIKPLWIWYIRGQPAYIQINSIAPRVRYNSTWKQNRISLSYIRPWLYIPIIWPIRLLRRWMGLSQNITEKRTSHQLDFNQHYQTSRGPKPSVTQTMHMSQWDLCHAGREYCWCSFTHIWAYERRQCAFVKPNRRKDLSLQ
jgi:hypothetical protein